MASAGIKKRARTRIRRSLNGHECPIDSKNLRECVKVAVRGLAARDQAALLRNSMETVFPFSDLSTIPMVEG
jgi:hypothetical protein